MSKNYSADLSKQDTKGGIAMSAYTTTRRRENSALVDISADGRVIASCVPEVEAAQVIADHQAATAARQAKIAAYAAAGLRIVSDASDMPRVARHRHRNRVAVITAGGQILAHYATILLVPDTPEVSDGIEALPVVVSSAPRTSTAQWVEDYTRETRVDGYILTDGGATQIFDES